MKSYELKQFVMVNSWVTSYDLYDLNKSPSQSETNENIELLRKQFLKILHEISIVDYLGAIKFDQINWNTFEIIAALLRNDINKGLQAKTVIINAYFQFIDQQDFYIELALNNINLKRFQNFSEALLLEPILLPAIADLIVKYQYYGEGWNVDQLEDSKYNSEFFVFGSIITLLDSKNIKEEYTRVSVAKEILKVLIEKHRFYIYDTSRSYYFLIYLLCYEIREYLPGLTNDLLTALINKIDEVDQLIFFFSQFEKSKIKGNPPKSFQTRVDEEFPFEIEKMQQRGQFDLIKRLENAIDKFNQS